MFLVVLSRSLHKSVVIYIVILTNILILNSLYFSYTFEHLCQSIVLISLTRIIYSLLVVILVLFRSLFGFVNLCSLLFIKFD